MEYKGVKSTARCSIDNRGMVEYKTCEDGESWWEIVKMLKLLGDQVDIKNKPQIDSFGDEIVPEYEIEIKVKKIHKGDING